MLAFLLTGVARQAMAALPALFVPVLQSSYRRADFRLGLQMQAAKTSAAIAAEVDDLQSCTVVILKERLKERGLSVAGRKAELVERLRAAILVDMKAARQKEQEAEEAQLEETCNDDDLEGCTIDFLKERLREQGLPISGKKSVLIERLRESLNTVEDEPESAAEDEEAADGPCDDDNMQGCTVVVLKEKLREKGLPVSGNKAELLKRLRPSASKDEASQPGASDLRSLLLS